MVCHTVHRATFLVILLSVVYISEFRYYKSMSNQDPIATLKLLRDVVDGFSNLTESLGNAAGQHNVELNQIKSFFANNPSALASIRDATSPEKLGLLVDLMIDFQNVQPGMSNFMDQDSAELKALGKTLRKLTLKFDDLLEGL